MIDELARIFNRLHPREVKWLTRLILKTTKPAEFPTDLSIASNQSHFPNIVKLNAEFPTSSPGVLRLGGTGVWNSTSAIHGFPTLKTTTSRISLELPTQEYRPKQRITKDMRSLRFDITKPDTFKRKLKNVVRVGQTPIHHRSEEFPRRPSKRRRMSRDSSPGPLVFQRGVLNPIRKTDISNNLSQRSSSFSKSLNEASSSQIVQRKSFDHQASLYVPTFTMGNSPSDRAQMVIHRISTSPAVDPSPSNSPAEVPKNNRLSGQQAMDSPKNHPTNPQLSKSMLATVSPPRWFARSRPSLASHISSKELTPAIVSPRHTPTPTLPSPAICRGTGACASLIGTPCLLDNYIFILGPHIPNLNHLLTTLLPSHASLFLSSPTQISHPLLPHRSPVTKRKYRKLILIETHPNFVVPTCDFLRSVGGMDLQVKGKNGEMKKEWICAFDWRLVESAGKAEYKGKLGDDGEGGRGYWQGGRWRKYYMCCV
ncbi:hypothetical protein BGZ60DRAFT_143158 [Tricladium varicosporioides]|nr:hypothetical protein BGZ60DRAFT_143158 [Hymenoscyphus varicosporioides]